MLFVSRASFAASSLFHTEGHQIPLSKTVLATKIIVFGKSIESHVAQTRWKYISRLSTARPYWNLYISADHYFKHRLQATPETIHSNNQQWVSAKSLDQVPFPALSCKARLVVDLQEGTTAPEVQEL